jgi:hypothetical protein
MEKLGMSLEHAIALSITEGRSVEIAHTADVERLLRAGNGALAVDVVNVDGRWLDCQGPGWRLHLMMRSRFDAVAASDKEAARVLAHAFCAASTVGEVRTALVFLAAVHGDMARDYQGWLSSDHFDCEWLLSREGMEAVRNEADHYLSRVEG